MMIAVAKGEIHSSVKDMWYTVFSQLYTTLHYNNTIQYDIASLVHNIDILL